MNLLINLDVDDLDKAVHFYSSVFGLRIGRSFGAFGVEMVGSSAPIYLPVKASFLAGLQGGGQILKRTDTIGSLRWLVRGEECRATLG